MRILWPGGVQRTAFAEAEQLIERGISVDLVFLRDTGREKYTTTVPHQVLFDPSIKNRLFGRIFKVITHRYAPHRGSDATVDLDLIRRYEVTRKEYDIVIYFDQQAAFFARYGQRLHGGKYVVQIHETSLKDKVVVPHFVEKRALRNAAAIITNSTRNKEILQSHGYENIHVIYPGLYPQPESPGFKSRSDVAISVTVWDRGRRPEVFLEIVKYLKTGSIVLAGSWADPNYQQEFMALIENEGLTGKLFVTGPLSENALREYYLHCKVGMRFGYNEAGPGMGSLEVISYGIPLLINSGIGIREILEADVNAMVVNEDRPHDIASSIERFFTDEELWNSFHQANVALAEKISWHNHGEALARVLNDVYDSHSDC
ncbi:MAG: glycosyltransferase family 4 protein [Nitrososphaerota archaeon]|nr:glycosyltransferase family 4 protein [Nitrososphaerota archaeon]